jgi:competence ComEA-like helix-hairpin-helix protein
VLLLATAMGVGTGLPLLGPGGSGFPQPRTPEQAAQVGVQAVEPRAGTSPTRFQSSIVGTLNLNTADAERLQALPGIGPALAEGVVAYRQEHGPFQTVEDLLRVPGIGPKRWERMRHAIRVTAEEP